MKLFELKELSFLQYEWLGNSAGRWLLAALTAVAVYVAARVVLTVLTSQARRISNGHKRTLFKEAAVVLERTKSLLLAAMALYVGSFVLSLTPRATDLIFRIFVIALIFQAGVWIARLIPIIIGTQLAAKGEGESSSALGLLNFIGQVALWAVVFLLILENAGIDVTALVAGLGVGGIAVALAVQNILGDLLASLSIVLDKPFVIGDFIVVGDDVGTVEKIGIKTTRVRSLSGEQLVFSNSDLLSSRIRNFKRMFERRIIFTVGVTYQTPREKLAEIPRVIEKIIRSNQSARFDRSHFKEFADSSLNIETVYFVLSPEFNTYMDVQQRINLELMEHFEKNKIEFAYPTRTLFIEKSELPLNQDRPQTPAQSIESGKG